MGLRYGATYPRFPARAAVLAAVAAACVASALGGCRHDKMGRGETGTVARDAGVREQGGQVITQGNNQTPAQNPGTPGSRNPNPGAQGHPPGAPGSDPAPGTSDANGRSPTVTGTTVGVAVGGPTATPTEATCVTNATDTCGPFAPELVEWCVEVVKGGLACKGNKWATATFTSGTSLLSGHLTNGTQASSWTPGCPQLVVKADKRVNLRPTAGYNDAALLEQAAPATVTAPAEGFKQWGAWRKIRIGDKDGWTLAILVACPTN